MWPADLIQLNDAIWQHMPNGSGSVEATRVPEWSSFVVRGRQRPERKGGKETQTPRVDDPPGSSAGTRWERQDDKQVSDFLFRY